MVEIAPLRYLGIAGPANECDWSALPRMSFVAHGRHFSASVASEAERGEVDAVDPERLATDPRGEEVAAREVVERDQRRYVTRELEVERAVGQVSLGTGQPCLPR